MLSRIKAAWAVLRSRGVIHNCDIVGGVWIDHTAKKIHISGNRMTGSSGAGIRLR